MKLKKITNSEEETKKLGKKIAETIKKKKKTIVLIGDLGAGKTKFTEGFLSYHNLEKEISSPTFTIVNEYENSKVKIYHFDVYRLSDVDEFYAIGGEEYFDKGISFIEWGNIVKTALPKEYLEIKIGKNEQNENERIFEMIPHGLHYQEIINNLSKEK